jgi:hypothetical protein
MPRGNRGKGYPHLGASGVLLAIILCSIIAGVLAYSSGRESERRNNAPASYTHAAKQDAQSACVGMETGAAFECIYEKVESSQDQARAEQDLSAQQRAASAAMISAIIAFLTLGATGLGVWYVKRTLDATLEAVKDTSEATQAMREANEIARDTKERQLRAYICLDNTQVIAIAPIIQEYVIKINVYNSGTTPAHNLSHACSWRFGDVEPTEAFARKYLDEYGKPEARKVFGPNRKIIIPVPVIIPIEFVEKIASGTGNFWFFGEFHYQDIFGCDRVTQYSYVYSTVLPNRFAQTDCFNRVT